MNADSSPSPHEIRAHACRLLGRREYSVRELLGRLQRKWPSSQEVGPVVNELAGEGLVNDSRFAEAFLRSRIARFQGPRKIRAELRARGVSEADVEHALRREEQDWTALASQWLRRQGCALPVDERRDAYYRRLVNRGFSHDQAMDALNNRPGV